MLCQQQLLIQKGELMESKEAWPLSGAQYNNDGDLVLKCTLSRDYQGVFGRNIICFAFYINPISLSAFWFNLKGMDESRNIQNSLFWSALHTCWVSYWCRCSVRVIKSHRSGVGKTLKVIGLGEQIKKMKNLTQAYNGPLLVSIPLHCRRIDQTSVLMNLLEYTLEPQQKVSRIFHIDIAHEVQTI